MQIFEVSLPAELYTDYSPKIDRWDVAIRAVWRLYRNGKWALLKDIGLVRNEVELQLVFAEDVLEGQKDDSWVSKLITICPAVLSGAIELLRRYNAITAMSRREFLKVEQVREDLSYRVRNRPSHARRA